MAFMVLEVPVVVVRKEVGWYCWKGEDRNGHGARYSLHDFMVGFGASPCIAAFRPGSAVAEHLGKFGSGDDERWRGEPRAMDYLQRGQSSRIRSHATVSHVSGRCGQEFFVVALVPESWLVF